MLLLWLLLLRWFEFRLTILLIPIVISSLALDTYLQWLILRIWPDEMLLISWSRSLLLLFLLHLWSSIKRISMFSITFIVSISILRLNNPRALLFLALFYFVYVLEFLIIAIRITIITILTLTHVIFIIMIGWYCWAFLDACSWTAWLVPTNTLPKSMLIRGILSTVVILVVQTVNMIRTSLAGTTI